MKRTLSTLATTLAVGGAAVLGFSTVAGAHHVDCDTRPDHPHCDNETDVPGASNGDPSACSGPATAHNPHCDVLPDVTTTTAGATTTMRATTTTTAIAASAGSPPGVTAANADRPPEVRGAREQRDEASDAPRSGDPSPAPAAEPSESEPRFAG